VIAMVAHFAPSGKTYGSARNWSAAGPPANFSHTLKRVRSLGYCGLVWLRMSSSLDDPFRTLGSSVVCPCCPRRALGLEHARRHAPLGRRWHLHGPWRAENFSNLSGRPKSMQQQRTPGEHGRQLSNQLTALDTFVCNCRGRAEDARGARAGGCGMIGIRLASSALALVYIGQPRQRVRGYFCPILQTLRVDATRTFSTGLLPKRNASINLLFRVGPRASTSDYCRPAAARVLSFLE
jgi:hypothetical protein